MNKMIAPAHHTQPAPKSQEKPGQVPGGGVSVAAPRPVEIGGRKNGAEPTRYGDWELNGKCVDF